MVRFSTGGSYFINSLTSLCWASTIKVPGAGHDYLKVFISVDTGRNIAVIFNELIFGNLAVRLVVVSHIVGGLKGLEKFNKNLILSPLALNYIGVLFGTVDSLDIFKFEYTISIFVHNSEGLKNKRCTDIVNWTTDST